MRNYNGWTPWTDVVAEAGYSHDFSPDERTRMFKTLGVQSHQIEVPKELRKRGQTRPVMVIPADLAPLALEELRAYRVRTTSVEFRRATIAGARARKKLGHKKEPKRAKKVRAIHTQKIKKTVRPLSKAELQVEFDQAVRKIIHLAPMLGVMSVTVQDGEAEIHQQTTITRTLKG